MDPAQPPRPLQWYRDFEPTDISEPDVTVKPEVLCKACLRVGPWFQDNHGVEESQRQTFTHCRSGQALEKGYEDGCHLCTLLFHALVEPDEDKYYYPLEKRLDDRNNRASQVRGGLEVTLTLGPSKYGTTDEVSFSIKTCIKLADGTGLDGQPLPLELAPLLYREALLDQSRLVCPSTQGISTLTCSESSLAQARTWLEECTQTHPRCQSQLPCTLPRRLLAVSRRSDGTHLQLKHSDELPDPGTLRWVCLSYCWGGSATLKLTNSTTPTLQDGIMADRLPKTIQDAASVVLALGLEFLWVDALCILQDSAEDWLHEAESMGDIYRGSFLTLAALGAADSSGGLFARRDPLIYSKCRISLENSEVAAIYPAWSNYPVHGTRLLRCPLYTRGWVIQERILARRTLRFGSTLSWECWEKAASELDPAERGIWDHNPEPLCSSFFQHVIDEGPSLDESPSPDQSPSPQAGQSPSPGQSPAPDQSATPDQSLASRPRSLSPGMQFAKNVAALWDSIVSDFSAANLTVLSDRQTAILGLVSAISLRTGWKPLAGYWLPMGTGFLLWKVLAGSIDKNRRTGVLPSWSWLSITGAVYFAPFITPNDKYVAEIEGVDEEDPTVPLRLSCLRLRLGPLEEEEYKAPEGWPTNNFFVWKDMPDSIPDELYVIPLQYHIEKTGYSSVEGIVVSPSRLCPDAYERVACFIHGMWDEAARAEMVPVMEWLYDVGRRETVTLV